MCLVVKRSLMLLLMLRNIRPPKTEYNNEENEDSTHNNAIYLLFIAFLAMIPSELIEYPLLHVCRGDIFHT